MILPFLKDLVEPWASSYLRSLVSDEQIEDQVVYPLLSRKKPRAFSKKHADYPQKLREYLYARHWTRQFLWRLGAGVLRVAVWFCLVRISLCILGIFFADHLDWDFLGGEIFFDLQRDSYVGFKTTSNFGLGFLSSYWSVAGFLKDRLVQMVTGQGNVLSFLLLLFLFGSSGALLYTREIPWGFTLSVDPDESWRGAEIPRKEEGKN